jgi:hypothetical protein
MRSLEAPANDQFFHGFISGHMRRAKRRKRNRIGRPPAGARPGEKVSEYPQLSVRLPPVMKLKLGALSLLQSKPQWRIMFESIECFISTLPESQQRKLHELINRRP